MGIIINQFDNIKIAEVVADEIVILNTQDALDIMGDANYWGAYKIIINEKNITSDFFELKTGIAGDILQKFSTYNVQLAIIGNFSKYMSKSLNDFILESNKYGRINFVSTVEEARSALLK